MQRLYLPPPPVWWVCSPRLYDVRARFAENVMRCPAFSEARRARKGQGTPALPSSREPVCSFLLPNSLPQGRNAQPPQAPRRQHSCPTDLLVGPPAQPTARPGQASKHIRARSRRPTPTKGRPRGPGRRRTRQGYPEPQGVPSQARPRPRPEPTRGRTTRPSIPESQRPQPRGRTTRPPREEASARNPSPEHPGIQGDRGAREPLGLRTAPPPPEYATTTRAVCRPLPSARKSQPEAAKEVRRDRQRIAKPPTPT
jgi:hypothetical protein